MIKTSANVPSKGGRTGNYGITGQGDVPNKAKNIKTSVSLKGRSHDSFYGGNPRMKSTIKTTGGYGSK